MTISEWATTMASLSAILAFLGAIISWIFKRYADSIVNKLVKEYLYELKPNSGSSLRDEVKAIRTDVTELKINLSGLEGRFDQHVAETRK